MGQENLRFSFKRLIDNQRTDLILSQNSHTTCDEVNVRKELCLPNSIRNSRINTSKDKAEQVPLKYQCVSCV